MLLIDTSTTACTVIYQCPDSGKAWSKQVNQPQGHTRLILSMIDDLLSEAGVSRLSLNKVAYVEGPGSFTGLRIGVSVAQGIAFATGAQVLGISAYQALKHQFVRDHGHSNVLVVGDARMNDLYLRDCIADTEHDTIISGELFKELCNSYRSDQTFAIIGAAKSLIDTLQLTELYIPNYEIPSVEALLSVVNEHNDCWQPMAVSAQPVYLRNEVNWKKRVKKADAWQHKNN